MATFELNVNGQTYTVEAEPSTPLLYILRNDVGLNGLRWITVVSPETVNDAELSLEPNANPAAKTFQEAMFTQGIPLAAFEVSDIKKDFERLKKAGVAFTQDPSPAGPVTIAVCSDTCGNLIQLYQPS